MPISINDLQCFARDTWERLSFPVYPKISSGWQTRSQCPVAPNARCGFSLLLQDFNRCLQSLYSITEEPLALIDGKSCNEAFK